MTSSASFLDRLGKNNSCRTFVIAEAGVHHGGSLEKACALVDAAAGSGADAIKFQTYKAETLVTHWAPKYWQPVSDDAGESQQAFFKRRGRLDLDAYRILAAHAKKKGDSFLFHPV